jgi:hypothetical protein
MAFNRFSEYKHLSQDSARISDRRETINNIYLSVNSVLLGAIALLVQQGGLKNLIYSLVGIFIAIAGFVISRDWKKLVENYRKLLRLRFKALRELEAREDFPGVIKIYQRETDELYHDDKGAFGFSPVEINLPGLFSTLYVVAIFAIILGSIIVNYTTLAQLFNLPTFVIR